MPDTEPTPETATETCTYTNPVYKGYFADPFVGTKAYIMRSELALRKRKDKWMKSQTQCVSTAPLTNCVSFPLALPRLHLAFCR